MMSSVDGRIVVDRWPTVEHLDEYEKTAETYRADAWMCGRVTMEPFAGSSRSEAVIRRERRRKARGKRADWIAKPDRGRCAVAIDASGRLLWKKNNIDGDHVIVVLSNVVSDDYLGRLRAKGVSYIFAPRARKPGEVDLSVALKKLADLFSIRTLLLEGGGGINGSMLGAGLVDEVSLLVAPIADGAVGVATTFDVPEGVRASRLTLKAVERRPGNIVWLRYSVGRGK